MEDAIVSAEETGILSLSEQGLRTLPPVPPQYDLSDLIELGTSQAGGVKRRRKQNGRGKNEWKRH